MLDMKTSLLYIERMTPSKNARHSRGDRARGQAELRDWLPAIVAITLLSAIIQLSWFRSHGELKLMWSLLNLLPALWIVRAVRSLRRADEYQRRRQLEALALGFAVLMMGIFTAGLLEAADAGVLRQTVQISFIAGTLTWILALLYKTQWSR
jgi:hypothetical protein